MRETKDQKISRLERRVKQLENELKELKKNNRSARKDNRAEISEMEKLHKKERDKLTEEMMEVYAKNNELKEQLHLISENFESICNKERSRQIRLTPEVIEQEKIIKELREISKMDADSRLESYKFGFTSDKWGVPFVDPKTLILNIDPNTGERLLYGTDRIIIDKIKYSNLYQEKLMFVYPFVEKAENNDIEAMDIIDEEGRYLYEKLYRDFPFEKYHM